MESKKAQSVRLFRGIESLANKFAEHLDGLSRDEASLRCATAWAEFTRDSHMAIIDRVHKSNRARVLAEPARRRRVRAEQLLRRRTMAVMLRKCALVKYEHLMRMAEFALSLAS